MSLSVRFGSWPDDGPRVLDASDDELRLCLDRSSDSDSQLGLNQSLTELIESITCKGDSGDEPTPSPKDSKGEDCGGGRSVVEDVVERILDRVEEAVGSAPHLTGVELADAREIDCGRSRDKKSRHPKKAGRRKHDLERKKSRRRSTSCSTTSSACSDISRKHRRKHKHHRRREEDCSPRVNPIFLWVKQDDTRIVEVLCEDYDKRNRIRLTKTAHGWRATPRTERLDSALSKISLDPTTPSMEGLPPLVSVKVEPLEPDELPQTKEKTPKRRVSRKYKLCDRKKDNGIKTEINYVDEYNNVDVVNNNNCSISNNNKIKIENRLSEPSLSEPRLRSFGYKKACHDKVSVNRTKKKKDNKKFDDFDVYTFVPTPKTDSEDDNDMDYDWSSECDKKPEVDLTIKKEIDSEIYETNLNHSNISTIDQPEPECIALKCRLEENSQIEGTEKIESLTTLNQTESKKEIPQADSIQNCDLSKESSPECQLNSTNDSPVVQEVLEENPSCKEVDHSLTLDIEKHQTMASEYNRDTDEHSTTTEEKRAIEESQVSLEESKTDSEKPNTVLEEPKTILCDAETSENTITKVDSSSEEYKIETTSPITITDNAVDKPDQSHFVNEPASYSEPHQSPKPSQFQINDVTTFMETNTQKQVEYDTHKSSNELSMQDSEEMEEEDPISEIILPEPHLHTPEPSPQPIPEPSTSEPQSSLRNISLQPETSLDSDTIHLPDTTTKSDTSSLISTDISLGQKLSIKSNTEINLESTLLQESLHTNSKSIHHPNISEQSCGEISKSAALMEQAEIERQITADLDEDHLLAIEEILQGEECVEDFDDDDLPEEYSVSDNSPVNLVLDLKAKDQVDNTGIPLLLRTDDFLEIFPTPLSTKEHSDISPPITVSKKQQYVDKPIPPAHQQSKTKFLESILSCPKRCHTDNTKKADSTDQQEPLYLGVSRKSASPTVSSSDSRKLSSSELEPKPKRMKIEDITLKTILNRNRDSFPKTKVSKPKESETTQQTADSTTKSRLLELLTNENEEHINKMDPLTQLKEVLSDPELNVPDPLLVPRARLPALVANPAKEIPRLLAMKSENLSYPKLLTDPDLLVVSLSHLQSLLQAAGKEEEMLKYQQHAQLLQQQMKQEQSTLDAATAQALNQMMWLPYLSQLEAAAMACGNTQDFMTMLNMVFPSGAYSQMNPYLMTPQSPGLNAYDYKSQLEFQQAFALWNEAMMQAATNQFAAQSLGTANNTNISSKLYQNYPETKPNPKQTSNTVGKHQESKHTSARTSPITLNYQQNKYRASQYPYTSMFSIPTSTPTTSHSSGSSTPYRTTPSQSQQSYQSSRQRGYNYSSYSSLKPPSSTPVASKDLSISGLSTADLYKSQQKHNSHNTSSCRSLMNILSKPKQSEVKNHHSHVSRSFPTSTTMLPRETTVQVTSCQKQDPPKLKVKQPQHLVDPNSRPKLLNFGDEHAEVGSTTGSLTSQVDETHPNLWHPLFSSHQQKSYSSPWQWTTPVTVAGE